jgi:hypothetical protein
MLRNENMYFLLLWLSEKKSVGRPKRSRGTAASTPMSAYGEASLDGSFGSASGSGASPVHRDAYREASIPADSQSTSSC